MNQTHLADGKRDSITNRQVFAFVLETLEHCGTFLLEADPEAVEWHLFEEFDGGSVTFLHENSLDSLLTGGYISAEVYALCRLLRKRFRSMEGTSLWNVESVKTASEWREILLLADEIRSLINGR